MAKTIGIVMDDIATIKTQKDSSFAILLAAQRAGHSCFYMQPQQLFMKQGVAMALWQRVEVADNTTDWYQLGDLEERPLAELDVVFMRKDPPFNIEYIVTTYILEQAEQAGVRVINKPQALRDLNEKFAIHFMPDYMPPTLVSSQRDQINRFIDEVGVVVLKPLDYMGGHGIFKVEPADGNRQVIIETLTEDGAKTIMAQQFVPEITEGDKRIILINGTAVPHSLVRIPNPGDHRGNIVTGASIKGDDLTPRDQEICRAAGALLKARGVYFAGIDIIGDYLTEVNVTSPTGIRELDRMYELDIAADLLAAVT